MADRELKALLEEHKQHLAVQDNGKILCVLNGHCMPARYDVVAAFVRGSKYQRLVRQVGAVSSLSQFEPFIVQSANFPTMLYCTLTGQLMDKSLDAVQRHMAGAKYKTSKERFDSRAIALKPEPSLESFGITLPAEDVPELPRGKMLSSQLRAQQKQAPITHSGGPESTARGSVASAGAKGGKTLGEHKPKAIFAGSQLNGVKGDAMDADTAQGGDEDDEGPGFWVPQGAESDADVEGDNAGDDRIRDDGGSTSDSGDASQDDGDEGHGHGTDEEMQDAEPGPHGTSAKTNGHAMDSGGASKQARGRRVENAQPDPATARPHATGQGARRARTEQGQQRKAELARHTGPAGSRAAGRSNAAVGGRKPPSTKANPAKHKAKRTKV